MAKQPQRKVPARRAGRPDDEDSLLIRSAESLGRIIGSLQRQLRALQLPNGDALSMSPPPAKKTSRKRVASAKAASKAKNAKKTKSARKSSH